LISKILPRVYTETIKNEALVRSVNFGPFKHQVDDGLELRKSAYMCIETLVDVAANRVIASDFVESLKRGFSDENEIQQLSYSALSKFAFRNPKGMLEILDVLPDVLMKNLKHHLKLSKSSSSESDSSVSILRLGLRALELIRHIPGSEHCSRFSYLLDRVHSTRLIQDMNNK
jgi:cullin-associated NEDD8-dissociated protein 1